MRISDWSSDVCSSDLLSDPAVAHREYHAVLVAVRLAFASHRIALEFDDDTRIFGGDGFDLRTQPGRQQLLERVDGADDGVVTARSEEHTSELQSLMRISYAVFCLKKKIKTTQNQTCKQTISEKHYRSRLQLTSNNP